MRAAGRKISQFPSSQVVPSDAEFTYVQAGVNYKVAFPDLLLALGATGSLVQEGDPLGVPVLDTQGSVYNIRNIESGSGIIATVSPQNGVLVSHNFDFDATGVRMSPDPTVASPVVRSLIAGPGVSISAAGDTVQISALDIPVSTRTVVINQISDFPAPIAGVITLDANTQYFIFNNISLGTTRIVMQDNTSIEGADSSVTTMSYTGAGDMFTAVDAGVRFGRIRLEAATGTILNFQNTAATKGCQFNDMTIGTCQRIATVAGANYIYLFDCLAIFLAGGVSVTGNVGLFVSMPNCYFIGAAGSVLDISAATSVSSVTISDGTVRLTGAGARFITGNGDTNITNTASVSNSRLQNPGGGTPFVGVSADNVKWVLTNNDLVRDSKAIGSVSLTNNATATAIAALNTPLLVAGTWALGSASQFTVTAAGRITSAMTKPATCIINVTGTAIMSAGPNNACTFYLYKNGVQVSAARGQITIDSADPRPFAIAWQDVVNPGDFFEVFAENNVDADDIVVRHCQFRVSA